MRVLTFGKNLVKTFLFIFVLFILCGTMFTMVKDFLSDYNLFNAEYESVTVIGKTAEKGLFQPPAHYVKVDINNKNPEDIYDGVLNQVTTMKMKNLKIGDKINGVIIDKNHFFTVYDIIVDSFVFIGVVLIMSIFILAMFIVAIDKLLPSKVDKKNFKREKRTKSKKNRQVNVQQDKGKQKYKDKERLKSKLRAKGKEKSKSAKKSFSFESTFLLIFFVVAGILSFTFIVNTVHKVVPIFQTKTEAVIVDKYSEREWLLQRPFSEQPSDPVFQFTLNYEDQNGETIRVVKEVTPTTFYRYNISDTVPVTYRNANPFDVFIKGSTLVDLFDVVGYWQFVIYSVISLVAIVTGMTALRRFYKQRRNNKVSK